MGIGVTYLRQKRGDEADKDIEEDGSGGEDKALEDEEGGIKGQPNCPAFEHVHTSTTHSPRTYTTPIAAPWSSSSLLPASSSAEGAPARPPWH